MGISAASTSADNVDRYDGLRPPQQLPRWMKQGTENATRSAAADDGNKAPENEAWIQEQEDIMPRMQPKVEIQASPRQEDEQTVEEGKYFFYYAMHWQKKHRL